MHHTAAVHKAGLTQAHGSLVLFDILPERSTSLRAHRHKATSGSSFAPMLPSDTCLHLDRRRLVFLMLPILALTLKVYNVLASV